MNPTLCLHKQIRSVTTYQPSEALSDCQLLRISGLYCRQCGMRLIFFGEPKVSEDGREFEIVICEAKAHLVQ